MRRIVVTEFVSADGVMEDPGGAEGFRHGGWTFKFNDPEGMKYKLDETLGHEALLLGRVTYEGFAKAWPGMTDDVGFADKMNAMPKYVVSRTLTQADWNNSTVLSGDLAGEVDALKAAGRRGHPGRRQRHAGARSHRPGIGRRVPADGVSDRARRGQAAVRGRRGRRSADAGRGQAARRAAP